MAASNYDVNVQLALATTAEHEGDLDSAFAFIAEAYRVAEDDHDAYARVHWFTARFLNRQRTQLSPMKQVSLNALAAAF